MLGVAVALALAVLGPVLTMPGFVLVYDMVFVPRQPLLPASLGIGPALPRAVPADAIVALVSAVLPGDLVQKLLLGGSLVAGALGAGRLVPSDRTATRVIAAVGYTWNAYVAERLFIGHWPVLMAYAVLPWIVLAGLRVRRGEARAWAVLTLTMLPAVIGPTGGLLAAGAAVAAVGRRRAAAAAALALVLNSPWWVPSLLRPAGAAVSDPAAVGAFAARAESWGGAVLSVLGLGGIWNADVVPGSRGSPVVPVVTVLLVALALYGCRELAQRWGAGPARALLLLGLLGVVIGVAGSVPPLDEGLRLLVEHVPGAGLLRDGQRWVAWWALVVAVGVAVGAERLADTLHDRAAPAGGAAGAAAHGAVLVGAALLPLALLPDLAWGGLGRLEPVRYPSDWAAVAELVDAEPDRGDVLVLPFMTYRAFAWNDDRIQLDPAPRLVPHPTVADDTLPVGPVVVGGEDQRVAQVREALARGRPLAELDVGWVLVEHGTPGELPAELSSRTPAYQGEWVSLYRVDGDGTAAARPGRAPTAAVVAADLAVLLLACGAVLWLLLPAGRVGAPTNGEG
jgi:hypothetical protein